MKPRHEQMHENRHRRKAGPFNSGHKRKPEPNDRDLVKEYGWKQPADYDFEYLEDVGDEENDDDGDEVRAGESGGESAGEESDAD